MVRVDSHFLTKSLITKTKVSLLRRFCPYPTTTTNSAMKEVFRTLIFIEKLPATSRDCRLLKNLIVYLSILLLSSNEYYMLVFGMNNEFVISIIWNIRVHMIQLVLHSFAKWLATPHFSSWTIFFVKKIWSIPTHF